MLYFLCCYSVCLPVAQFWCSSDYMEARNIMELGLGLPVPISGWGPWGTGHKHQAKEPWRSVPALLLVIRDTFPQGHSQVLIKHIYVIELYWAQSLVICHFSDFCFTLSGLGISQCLSAPCVSARVIFSLPLRTSHPIIQSLPLIHTRQSNLQTWSLKFFISFEHFLTRLVCCLLFWRHL